MERKKDRRAIRVVDGGGDEMIPSYILYEVNGCLQHQRILVGGMKPSKDGRSKVGGPARLIYQMNTEKG